MEVIITKDPIEAARLIAGQIAELIRKKPSAVLGLATGSTPLGLYEELIRLHREEGLDFSRVSTFNLDEYLGLPAEHEASYRFFMRKNLFQHVNVDPARTFIPNGTVSGAAVEDECAAFEQRIAAAGGIDYQVLGIGGDGHIGFNEPGSSLASRTRIKTLTERTRADNARHFAEGETMPHHVITMGIGTILEARCVALLAFGAGKADAVAGAVEGPVSASNPASALQFHRTARVVVDEAAASQLRRADYYRWVWANKPDWQGGAERVVRGE
ncbi:MAG: glucosamine-6-phosphate deaminase [Chthoniobacterales bacterium]